MLSLPHRGVRTGIMINTLQRTRGLDLYWSRGYAQKQRQHIQFKPAGKTGKTGKSRAIMVAAKPANKKVYGYLNVLGKL